MKRKYSFEIRQLDCWCYGGDWTQNTSYLIGTMETGAKDEKTCFCALSEPETWYHFQAEQNTD